MEIALVISSPVILIMYYTGSKISILDVTGGKVDELNNTLTITTSQGVFFEGIITEEKTYNGTAGTATSFSFIYVLGE